MTEEHPLRILVVEDEMIIAFFIEDCLAALGHETVGPASRVGRAMKFVETEELDLALLDINVAGEEIYPVAAELKARGIPFIFLSGYGSRGLHGEWTGSSLLEKPFAPEALESGIAAMVRPDATTFGAKLGKSPNTMVKLSIEEQPQRSQTTLFDVLYAGSDAPAQERDWAGLVRSVAAGDQRALHALYERAHRSVFTLIMRTTANRETAEELTIDVFHDVWRGAVRYDAANGTVLGWIMNQARSRAIDRLRFENRKKRKRREIQLETDLSADPHDVLELREQTQSLSAALAVLTPEERQAIEATFFAELTHAEAAAQLNQPLGTVKTRIRSGLHKLRRTLIASGGRP